MLPLPISSTPLSRSSFSSAPRLACQGAGFEKSMLSCSMGISALGYMWRVMLQVPWSSPHSWSCTTCVAVMEPAMSPARAGLPGAGYRTAERAAGKPLKSCSVGGAVMAVTRVPRVYQWALMHSTAAGRGISRPSWAHRLEKSLSSMAFIGEPWPTKSTGMRGPAGHARASEAKSLSEVVISSPAAPWRINSLRVMVASSCLLACLALTRVMVRGAE